MEWSSKSIKSFYERNRESYNKLARESNHWVGSKRNARWESSEEIALDRHAFQSRARYAIQTWVAFPQKVCAFHTFAAKLQSADWSVPSASHIRIAEELLSESLSYIVTTLGIIIKSASCTLEKNMPAVTARAGALTTAWVQSQVLTRRVTPAPRLVHIIPWPARKLIRKPMSRPAQ